MTPPRSSVNRGPAPNPATVDWEKAYRALVEACMTAPIKQHDRSPDEQAAVERYTTRLVQAGELLAGPELGLMDRPLHDGCSADEFLKPGVGDRIPTMAEIPKSICETLLDVLVEFGIHAEPPRGIKPPRLVVALYEAAARHYEPVIGEAFRLGEAQE